MKTTKNIISEDKKLIPLTQSEKGKLKGGFSKFSAGEKLEPITNVNVDVASEHTCACAC
ncbi:hypothetical protein [Pedobacter sp. WC2423]|uniref:hypothetical protein n=1 Tax=Pedobacter sp. WC2423 TaxID=3234142 RepID=UPI00346625E7